MSKTIYSFNHVTGEFVGSDVARESPMEPGVYLIPANATDIEPCQVPDGSVPVFLNGRWEVQEDHRNTVYWLPDGSQHVMNEIGALPQGASTTAPPASLSKAQTDQSVIIGMACAAAIIGGFQSSALGKAYTYPSQQTDQANLAANVLSSRYPGLPANWTTLQLCADSKGVWDYRPHTAAQIQQVGSDGKAAIMACLTKNATLQAQIKAASDVATVQQIVW